MKTVVLKLLRKLDNSELSVSGVVLLELIYVVLKDRSPETQLSTSGLKHGLLQCSP